MEELAKKINATLINIYYTCNTNKYQPEKCVHVLVYSAFVSHPFCGNLKSIAHNYGPQKTEIKVNYMRHVYIKVRISAGFNSVAN